MTEPEPEPEPEAGSSPNLVLGVLRRWPWLVLGVIAGLVVGFLYHMQRPAVYQSTARLLVKKVNPTSAGGGGDSRVAYLEDYVATQVIMLKTSDAILKRASQKLSKGDAGAGYLAAQLGVAREREPGSNQLSNILLLTFRAGDRTEVENALKEIIAAYQAELETLYEEASTKELRRIDADIQRVRGQRSKADAALQAERTKLWGTPESPGVGQESLESVRARISANKAHQSELRRKLTRIEQDIARIRGVAGKSRAARLDVMYELGVRPDRTYAVVGLDSRDPDELLFALQLEYERLGQRLGEDHRDMVDLRAQLARVRKVIEQQRGEGQKADELERQLVNLTRDSNLLTKEAADLDKIIKADEEAATQMSALKGSIDAREAAAKQLGSELDTLSRERERVFTTRSTGGYEAKEISPPGRGVQVGPVLSQSLLLGGVLGLMLGCGVGLIAELSDRSFRNPAEIRRRLGVPVLGHVPKIHGTVRGSKAPTDGLDPGLVVHLHPSSVEAEAFRGIRTQLYFSTRGRGHQVIQVTSPHPGDGKSTLAANLAISIAQSGKRVVLLDCDFRKPRVHRMFDLHHPDVGLASVMAGDARLESATQSTSVPNLWLLPCGPRPANPAELLTSPKFNEVLAELQSEYEFVIVDSPPVLAVSDPAAIAPRVDGVLLVFRMKKDSRPSAERARDVLRGVGARILGVVVNASTNRAAGIGGYGYAYQYQYQYVDNYTTGTDEPEARSLPKKG